MPILTLEPGHKQIEVPEGANLMESIIAAGMPIGSSCGSVAVCAKCHVKVLAGAENLSPIEVQEAKLLKRDKIPEGSRISCQARIMGSVTVTTSYW